MTGSAIVTKSPANGSPDDAVEGGAQAAGWEPLLAACRAERSALDNCPRIWVALSGGADSNALLHAVLLAGFSSPISVSHIDHGVQPDSTRWAVDCAELCQRLGVPLQVHRLTPPADGRFPGGFEAWARSERYACWRRLLGAGEVLLCAHHADDQAETVALRLLQGRLPLPIPKRRALGAGPLLRPLLALPRTTLRQALVADGRNWLEDSSNQDARFLRNQVRRLLPQLEGNGDWPAALRRCGDLVQRLQRALQAALKLPGSDAPAPDAVIAMAGELGRLLLAAIPGAVALQGVLAVFGSGPVSRGQASDALRRLREQAKSGAASGAARGGVRVGGAQAGARPESGQVTPVANVAGELRLFVDGLDMVIWREPVFAPIALAGRGREQVDLPHGSLIVEFANDMTGSATTAGDSETASAAAAVFCVVRPLAPADRLLRNGRQQPVKELLRANGVPRWARGSYPVSAAGAVILAVPAGGPPAGAPSAGSGLPVNGWLRDGAAQDGLIRLSWRANLPS